MAGRTPPQITEPVQTTKTDSFTSQQTALLKTAKLATTALEPAIAIGPTNGLQGAVLTTKDPTPISKLRPTLIRRRTGITTTGHTTQVQLVSDRAPPQTPPNGLHPRTPTTRRSKSKTTATTDPRLSGETWYTRTASPPAWTSVRLRTARTRPLRKIDTPALRTPQPDRPTTTRLPQNP